MRRVVKKVFLLLLVVLNSSAFAQVGQINIPRVEQMPNMPSPYLMRNWKEVATQYDQFIFSTPATGQYLPLLNLKPAGINFPEVSPILLQTYVGTNSVNQAEAINIIPALVGASLMDIDKSNQGGINWVVKAKDFFNKSNGQNVFLNGYSAQSGGDWWYDVMPNIFFYQLYSQYPAQTDFQELLSNSADRWLEAVHAMGGKTTPWTVPQMNYRAWDLMTMTGNADGVKEPEAAGGIGWLLYHAYLTTGETKYLDGAQMSLEFLTNLTANPAYELQLPYGAFIAAKMNAELGTAYDISKMVNWTFDRSPSRGWGAIVGTWNGSDVDGLIGEANDSGNDYAFIMNGFQQASALVPLVKYDKRFTRGIAKWILNLANASRLFYSNYLPQASQDDYTWSSTVDPQSTIAYEALKEKNNFNNNLPLYGTGDAKRNNWAQTNLSLYGSSSVGYLAAVVEPSDVPGILMLDVNKTDFFSNAIYPSYVLYNPYATEKQATLQLPSGSHDIYDAISETVLVTNASGTIQLTMKADETVLVTYIPAGSNREQRNGKLYVGNEVIDHHYGYDFTGSLRIKSLAVGDTLVEYNQQVPFFVATENVSAGAVYTWFDNDDLIETSLTSAFTWTVPEISGEHVLRLQVEANGKSASDSIVFNVVVHIPTPPVINSLSSDLSWYPIGSKPLITCNASDKENTTAQLTYEWSVSAGSIISEGAKVTWQPPAVEGLFEITCKVTDLDAMSTTQKKSILVKPTTSGATPAFAYYPLDGDAKDYSGNHRDATMVGVDMVADARGEPGKAYLFNSGSDIIYLSNSSDLNFQDKIALAFWVNLESLSEESFILSHGSWEERWKVSITPDRHLRWTIKTNVGTKDLDSSFPLVLNQYYHFAVVYSGYSMELYADGKLDTFSAHSGLMGTTGKPLTLGRKDGNVTRYSLFGILDEVRIYSTTLQPGEISTLNTIWNTVVTDIQELESHIQIYPNPTSHDFYINGIDGETIERVNIFDINGRAVNFTMQSVGKQLFITIQDHPAGIVILELQTQNALHHKKILITNGK
jgi:hypothetical protein